VLPHEGDPFQHLYIGVRQIFKSIKFSIFEITLDIDKLEEMITLRYNREGQLCCCCFNPWFTWCREPGGP